MDGTTLVIGAIAILIVGWLVMYLVSVYNSLIRVRNNVDEAWANIGVLLKQRHDELPKLIEVCKGYMQCEQKTLQSLTDARTAGAKAASISDKAQADNMMSGALKGLFAVAENYPDLKANSSFTQLQSRVSDLEERISDRREYFNDSVNRFNTRIAQLPDSILAGLMNMSRKDLFSAADEDSRDVEIKFA